MGKFKIIIVLFVMLSHHAIAQHRNTFIKDSLDGYIERAMKLWRVPGLAVAVTRGDDVIYAKGFGVLRTGHPSQVNHQTLFPIGSMGKSFTAFSIELLQQEKKLSLDDKVKRWLPWFTMSDKNYEADLRISDVLSHRTGIQTFQGDLLWTESSLSSRDIINKWGKFTPSFPIRSSFGYCNIGYLIAGEIIHAASGEDWSSYQRKHILSKLNMKNSLPSLNEVKTMKNVAFGHTIAQGSLTTIPEGTGVMQPFGGMYSNVDDMAKWVMMHANDGRLNGIQVFPEDLVWSARGPYSIVGKQFFPNGQQLMVNYGLGWDIVNYFNREVVSHGGAYSGFLSMMGFMPSEKLGFVILTNSDAHELAEALRWQIIDAVLGIEAPDYSSRMYEYVKSNGERQEMEVQKWKDSARVNSKADISLGNFEGVYHNDIYGKMTLRQSAGNLTLHLEHHPGLSANLQWLGNNRFLCTYNHPMFGTVVLPFTVADGKVTGVTLSVHPFLEFTNYYFRKQ